LGRGFPGYSHNRERKEENLLRDKSLFNIGLPLSYYPVLILAGGPVRKISSSKEGNSETGWKKSQKRVVQGARGRIRAGKGKLTSHTEGVDAARVESAIV